MDWLDYAMEEALANKERFFPMSAWALSLQVMISQMHGGYNSNRLVQESIFGYPIKWTDEIE